MAKTAKRQPWTKEYIRMLKAMVREKTMTNVIARRPKRTAAATYQEALRLGVTLGEEDIADESATGKQSQVLVAAVNRHMPATPACGNQPRVKDANEVLPPAAPALVLRRYQEHGQGAQALPSLSPGALLSQECRG